GAGAVGGGDGLHPRRRPSQSHRRLSSHSDCESKRSEAKAFAQSSRTSPVFHFSGPIIRAVFPATRSPVAQHSDRSLTLPFRMVMLPFLVVIGCWIAAPRTMGQEVSRDRAQSTDAELAQALGGEPKADGEFERITHTLEALGQEQQKPTDASGSEIDRLKSKVELQQKQIEVLLKMTKLLA